MEALQRQGEAEAEEVSKLAFLRIFPILSPLLPFLHRLDELESGAFDATSFLKWQSDMRAADLAAELGEVERRRLEGKLSYEEAILARRRLEEANREAAAQMKAAAAAVMAETAEERALEEEQARHLVEAVLACRTNAKKAKKDLQQKKHKIGENAFFLFQ